MREIHSEVDARIGAYLRSAREARGLAVADVAARAGCDSSTLEMYERGEDYVGAERLRELAPAYGVGVVEAFVAAGLLSEQDLCAWRTTA